MSGSQALCQKMFLLVLSLWSVCVCSSETAFDQQMLLVNDRLFLLKSTDSALNPEQAFLSFTQGAFTENSENKVSFGFSKATLWAILPFENLSQTPMQSIIEIDNAWLDELDLFFFSDGDLIRQVSIGDSVPFTQRERSSRMPSVNHDFPVGVSYVLFKFKSQDPMTIPIYIGSEKAAATKFSENAYFYGALYGGLLILLIYNLALYVYLRELKYLLYPCYLFAFTSFNFTYTGHGFWLLWSNSITLQQWLMPIFMFVYIFSAVLFTIGFLNIRDYLPKLYTYKSRLLSGLLLIGMALFLLGSRSQIVMIQLAMLTLLSIWMICIGALAYKNKDPVAKFFLPAITMGTGGATFSSFATWGLIPYSQWAFRGIEVGMLLEMSLLSISLGFNFKLAQEAQKSAENNARHDPLTNLYNRRAFAELVHPSWELGKRNNTPMSILLMDLDWFKRINDSYGHAAGDEILEKVAAEISARVRDSDIALRWGGEEFLILLPNTNSEQAALFAEDIRQRIERLDFNKTKGVTMSIGVVSANPKQIELDKLISLADEALYLAKEKGRNKVEVVASH